MTIDRPLRALLAREIGEALAGTRVRRIHQPEPETLVVQLHGRRCDPRLLASADPKLARVHLTTRAPDNPPSPPPFCMLARKHLKGRPFLEAIALPHLPVIEIRFGPRLGEDPAEVVALCVEMTGHASTILLVGGHEGDRRILGSIRALPGARRDLAPGARHVWPSLPGRLDPRTATAETLAETIARLGGAVGTRRTESRERLLSRVFEGVGRRLAAEALLRAGVVLKGSPAGLSSSHAGRILQALRELLDMPCAPQIAIDAQGLPCEALPFPLPSLDLRLEPAASASEALERVSTAQGSAARLEAERVRILRILSRQITHRETKLARRRDDLAAARQSERHRRQADLLLAQGDPARRAGASIEVPDLYDPQGRRLTIELDPRLTLAQNAERLYQRAKKAARAVRRLSDLIAHGEEELRFLAEERMHAEQAGDLETLSAIDESLLVATQPRTRVPRQKRAAPKRDTETPAPHRFDFEGWEILVGRHARGNDRLVAQGAAHDLWFHARALPGAHVLLRNPTRLAPPSSVVHAAARIAAHFSKARAEAGVDVLVAELRHVRKRRGQPPGQVEVTQSRTLRVRPGLPSPGHSTSSSSKEGPNAIVPRKE